MATRPHERPGIPRKVIPAAFFYVQDERYAAGAGMRRSGVCQFCTAIHLRPAFIESLRNPSRTVPTDPPRQGYLPLRHAASPSVGRSDAGMAQATLSAGSRLHLVPAGYGLRGRYPHGPGQSLDRFPVSPSPGLASVDSGGGKTDFLIGF